MRRAEAMDKTLHIQVLADELLDNILSFLVVPEQSVDGIADPQTSVNGASRYGEQSDLDRFRLVCKRFMRIGTPRKFCRFVLRFSSDGFKRLSEFLDTQLVRHVRYFTYMVRPFYEGNDWPVVLYSALASKYTFAHVHKLRLQHQVQLVDKGVDISLLRRAIAAFPALQQVKLLRLQDRFDERLQEYIRHRQELVRLNWEPACTRAVANLGISLLHSSWTYIRFIGPQICPEAALNLPQAPTASLSAVAARLTSLEINFHAHAERNTATAATTTTATMRSLSPIIHNFLQATEHLSALHLGFPAQKPLDLTPEQLFHRIHWKSLRTLSLQGWCLAADDLIAFLRRHRHQLRNLRLLSIYLPVGVRWRDVLAVLHDDLEYLERIDLRGIDYMRPASGTGTGTGTGTGFEDNHSNGAHHPTSPANTIRPSHSDHAVVTEDLYSFAHRPIRTPPCVPVGMSMDRLRALSAEDLDDDGLSVDHEQTALWEPWVLSSSSM